MNWVRCCSAFAPTPSLWCETRRPKTEIDASRRGVMQSVEALQQANRRILDRLRPLHIQELGLEKSIQTVLQNARSQAPELKLTSEIDAELNDIDGMLSQTVYRVIQEGVTNVLRHANASEIDIKAVIHDRQVAVDISPTTASGFRCRSGLRKGVDGNA